MTITNDQLVAMCKSEHGLPDGLFQQLIKCPKHKVMMLDVYTSATYPTTWIMVEPAFKDETHNEINNVLTSMIEGKTVGDTDNEFTFLLKDDRYFDEAGKKELIRIRDEAIPKSTRTQFCVVYAMYATGPNEMKYGAPFCAYLERVENKFTWYNADGDRQIGDPVELADVPDYLN